MAVLKIPRLLPPNTIILLVWYYGPLLLCAYLLLQHKIIGLRVRFLNEIFNKYITIFNLLLRLVLDMVDLFLNCVKYISTKSTFTYLEV